MLARKGTPGSKVMGIQMVVSSVVVPSKCQQQATVEARGWRMARSVVWRLSIANLLERNVKHTNVAKVLPSSFMANKMGPSYLKK